MQRRNTHTQPALIPEPGWVATIAWPDGFVLTRTFTQRRYAADHVRANGYGASYATIIREGQPLFQLEK